MRSLETFTIVRRREGLQVVCLDRGFPLLQLASSLPATSCSVHKLYVCVYLMIGKGQIAQKRPYWGSCAGILVRRRRSCLSNILLPSNHVQMGGVQITYPNTAPFQPNHHGFIPRRSYWLVLVSVFTWVGITNRVDHVTDGGILETLTREVINHTPLSVLAYVCMCDPVPYALCKVRCSALRSFVLCCA